MRRTLSTGALVLLLSLPAAAQSIEPVPDTSLAVKTASLAIDGTSTMHDYKLTTRELKVVSTVAPGVTLLQAEALKAFELQIPVNSFVSEKDGLKKKMLETIKAAKHPDITFRMLSYSVELAADGRAAVLATGALTVAGVEQTVDLKLDVEEAPGGIRIKGGRDLSMKDFGIKAPTMFMGMLKTNDKVTITFDLHLMRAAMASN